MKALKDFSIKVDGALVHVKAGDDVSGLRLPDAITENKSLIQKGKSKAFKLTETDKEEK